MFVLLWSAHCISPIAMLVWTVVVNMNDAASRSARLDAQCENYVQIFRMNLLYLQSKWVFSMEPARLQLVVGQIDKIETDSKRRPLVFFQQFCSHCGFSCSVGRVMGRFSWMQFATLPLDATKSYTLDFKVSGMSSVAVETSFSTCVVF